MKGFYKLILAGSLMFFASLVWAGGKADSPQGGGKAAYTVGMTVQDLSNPVWAMTAEELNRLITADGGRFIYVDCKSNAPTQITQLENFISSGVDLILLHAADGNAVEETLARARAKGIRVI
jgi:ribose transport system substrate-binding protein